MIELIGLDKQGDILREVAPGGHIFDGIADVDLMKTCTSGVRFHCHDPDMVIASVVTGSGSGTILT